MQRHGARLEEERQELTGPVFRGQAMGRAEGRQAKCCRSGGSAPTNVPVSPRVPSEGPVESFSAGILLLTSHGGFVPNEALIGAFLCYGKLSALVRRTHGISRGSVNNGA